MQNQLPPRAPQPSRLQKKTLALTSLLILLGCFMHGLFPASRRLRHVVELKQMRNSRNCVLMWLTSTMTKAFHTVDVDLWLDSGTLIAYHRHPDRLIDGDYDVDVGMSVDDCHKVTLAAASHALQVQATKEPPPTTCLQHPRDPNIVFKPYMACNLTSGYVYAKVFYNWKNAHGEEKSVHGDIFRWNGNLLVQKLTPYWNRRLASNKEMYQDWWVLVGNGNGHSNANPIPPSALYPLQKGVLGGFKVLVPHDPKTVLEAWYDSVERWPREAIQELDPSPLTHGLTLCCLFLHLLATWTGGNTTSTTTVGVQPWQAFVAQTLYMNCVVLYVFTIAVVGWKELAGLVAVFLVLVASMQALRLRTFRHQCGQPIVDVLPKTKYKETTASLASLASPAAANSRKTKGLMLFHVLAMVSLLKDVWVGLLRGVVAHSWARAGEWSVPFGGGSSSARWANEEFALPTVSF